MASPIDPRCLPTQPWVVIAYTYVVPMLTVFGAIHETFVLATIHHGNLKDFPYDYLRCFAWADLVQLVIIMANCAYRRILSHLSVEAVLLSERYYWAPASTVAKLLKEWLILMTLAILIERFLSVRPPVEARNHCARGRAKKVSLCLLLVAFSSVPATAMWIEFKIHRMVFQPAVKDEKEFYCAPNINESDSTDLMTCHNAEFPFDLRSSITVNCTDVEFERNFELRHRSRWKQPLSIQECLHHSCKLPRIPENSSYVLAKIGNNHVDSGVIIEYDSTSSTRVMRWTAEDVPLEDLVGRGMYMNGTCFFLMAPLDAGHSLDLMRERLLNESSETVSCVKQIVWQFKNCYDFAVFWERIYIGCIGVLSMINILLGFEIHRAEGSACRNDFPDNERGSTLELGERDQSRLTLTLLALSTVKILSHVVSLMGDMIAPFFHDAPFREPESMPPWLSQKFAASASTEYRCMYQGLISDVTSVLEYTSHFYLLVLINRKFKRKFFHQLMHGKLRVRGLSQSLQKLFSRSSRHTSGGNVKEDDGQIPPSKEAEDIRAQE